jgi:hypothetical protein
MNSCLNGSTLVSSIDIDPSPWHIGPFPWPYRGTSIVFGICRTCIEIVVSCLEVSATTPRTTILMQILQQCRIVTVPNSSLAGPFIPWAPEFMQIFHNMQVSKFCSRIAHCNLIPKRKSVCMQILQCIQLPKLCSNVTCKRTITAWTEILKSILYFITSKCPAVYSFARWKPKKYVVQLLY